MAWNFCPWCGHRVYQHNIKGCTHVDAVWVEQTAKTVRQPCDCKKPHPLMVDH
jgi:hypothetical protein